MLALSGAPFMPATQRSIMIGADGGGAEGAGVGPAGALVMGGTGGCAKPASGTMPTLPFATAASVTTGPSELVVVGAFAAQATSTAAQREAARRI